MDNSKVTVVNNNVDQVFIWKSEENQTANRCRIRIYWVTWEKAIVIATELSDQRARTIASATKELIRFVSNLLDLVPHKIMLIEHYSVSNSLDKDTYVQVLLTENRVVKYEIKKEHLAELIGKPI